MGGMPPVGAGEAPPPELRPPPPPPPPGTPVVGGRLEPPEPPLAAPPTPTGFAPLAGIVTLEAGRSPLPGFIGVTGFLPGSGEAGLGVWVSVLDMSVLVYGIPGV